MFIQCRISFVTTNYTYAERNIFYLCQIDIELDRQIDIELDRQIDIELDRQIDNHLQPMYQIIDTQGQIETQTDREENLCIAKTTKADKKTQNKKALQLRDPYSQN